MTRHLAIVLILAVLGSAQSTVLTQTTVLTGTTKLALTVPVFNPGMVYGFDITTSCSASTSSCTVSLCSTGLNCMPPTTSGAALIVAAFLTNSATITSAYLCNSSSGCTSGNATATFSLCPGSNCAVYNATMAFGNDAAYVLSVPAGSAFVTVNLSASQSAGAWAFNVIEVLPPPTYSFSALDSSGASSNSTCTVCTLSQPSLTGTDLVFEYNDFNGQPAAGPNFQSPYITDQFANAICLDCNTTVAPVMTQVSGTGTAWSWLALKTTAGSYTTAPGTIKLVNHAMQGLNAPVACNLACPAFTIPSTTAGNLLRIALIENDGTSGYISSVSGCGTWVVPGAALRTIGDAFIYASGAYNLSATGGCTSITVTVANAVSSTATVGAAVSYWEISKPTGVWQSDTYGCTSNASGSNAPPGQALTLNNTIALHVIFQFIADAGGVSGITTYPWTTNGGNPSAYNGSTAGGNNNFGSDVVQLNTISGAAPIWEYPNPSPAATGVCADAYY